MSEVRFDAQSWRDASTQHVKDGAALDRVVADALTANPLDFTAMSEIDHATHTGSHGKSIDIGRLRLGVKSRYSAEASAMDTTAANYAAAALQATAIAQGLVK